LAFAVGQRPAFDGCEGLAVLDPPLDRTERGVEGIECLELRAVILDLFPEGDVAPRVLAGINDIEAAIAPAGPGALEDGIIGWLGLRACLQIERRVSACDLPR